MGTLSRLKNLPNPPEPRIFEGMKYPIGIQDFQELREGEFQYVDKTQYIHHLLTTGKYFFRSQQSGEHHI